MPDYIDMHMHTTASDGVTSPAGLLDIVRGSGVRAFAVTDHDTFVGSAAIRDLLADDDPELVTAVELSAGEPGEDLHLLVYLFGTPKVAPGSPLDLAVGEFHRRRNRRGESMVELLQKKGLNISMEDVKKFAGDSPIGRPHIADALTHNGAVKSYDAAFRNWIGYGKPGFVEKENIRPTEAMSLAHDAGGIVVLAHPAVNRAGDQIKRLVDCGLDGIEVWHPANSQTQRKRFREQAEKYDLVISGGSDYHGRDDHHGEVGQMQVAYERLLEMKNRAKRYM